MTAIHAVEDDDAISAVLRAPLPDIDIDSCGPTDTLILAPFLRAHLSGLHPYLVELDLHTAVDVLRVLPAGARVLRWNKRGSSPQVLASYDGCLIVVRAWNRAADLWVSGVDEERVTAVAAAVKAKAPKPPVTRAVRVTFWQKGRHVWERSRELDVPTWDEIAELYPASVREAMARLTLYRAGDHAAGGRLLLWHGPPGTGKTTAVRALFDAWRSWASAHVVSDPEQLLNNADYMNEVLDPDDENGSARWRLVVIEDAEELLRRNAREQVGAALGRLLNSADGLLGQGSRSLILLTTNEPLDEMHPALLRPGRCLARIEFPPLSAAEAGAILGTGDAGAPATLAEVVERRGLLQRIEAVADPLRPGLYL